MDKSKELNNLKKELGLEFATDSEILRLSLQCSQGIKYELLNDKNKVGVYDIVNALQKADEIILNHLMGRK